MQERNKETLPVSGNWKARAVSPTRIPKQSMYVSWKCMSPRENVLNLLCRKTIKITLQAKEKLWWPITIWFISLFRCRKRWKFRMQSSSGQRMEETWGNSSLAVGKSRKQEGGYSGSTKRDKRKSTLLHWWTSVIPIMQSLNPNFRSTRVESCSEETL